MSAQAPDSAPKTTSPPKMRFAEAIAGGAAGSLTVLLLHPLDTLKTVLQSAQGAHTNRAALRSLLASGGFSALYRGAVPALLGTASAWAVYFQTAYALRGGTSPGSALAPGGFSRDFAIGATAGVVSALSTNPIWVVKTRSQVQNENTSTVNIVRFIARNEGYHAFYRGLGPSIWLVMNGAIQFTLYERFKDLLRPVDAVDGPTSAVHSLIASTASKLVASVTTYPLQVVRTRMQERSAQKRGYTTIPKAALKLFHIDGVRGFYRGIAANIVRVLPATAVTFVTYEQVLNFLQAT